MIADVGVLGDDRAEALQGRPVVLAFVVKVPDPEFVPRQALLAGNDVIGGTAGVGVIRELLLEPLECLQGFAGCGLIPVGG